MAHPQPKIMVVDDDDSLRITLTAILEDEGFEVTAASDGLKAVELATKHDFDLIFLDVRMPGLGGIEACRRIKEISPDTIIILLTALATQALIDQALEEGAFAVHHKPFDVWQLISLVRTVMRSTCVLVVDDQPENRTTMRAILEDSGHQVTEAENGYEAVSRAGNTHFDVILMDAIMPGMDGFAAGEFSLLTKPVEPGEIISAIKSVVETNDSGVEGSRQ